MPHPVRLFSTLLRPAESFSSKQLKGFSRHISRLIFIGLSNPTLSSGVEFIYL